MGPKLHSELGRTVGLMLSMCEPLFYTGKYVVMDNDFFVANEIVALATKGVYSGTLIKKRKRFQGIPLTVILRTRRWGM